MNPAKQSFRSSNSTGTPPSRTLEGGLFLIIVLIEAGLFLYLIHARLLPGWHDEFQYFTLQYYFLNNVITAGEIPQWIPFMTHGTVAGWWYIIQAGIFQNVLLLSGQIWKGVNFLPLFYIGVLVDELLLAGGVWLLGKRFFSSPSTVFFVTLSVLGSCIWTLQPWWNFHFYYAVPLLLYLLHCFVDSGKWRYYFLAGNLLFVQCLGNLPYFLPMILLVIFIYFLFYFLFNLAESRVKVKAINWDWSFVVCTLILFLLFIALYAVINFGTDQLVHYTSRRPDGSLPLEVFLHYGGEMGWKFWLEMILGVSPGLDYSLYIGIIGVPLILLGLMLNVSKGNIHFLATVIVLLLFSMGTFVSVFFYYCWPMMNYFRHLMLVAPLIKVLFCFLAGFGLEAVFAANPLQKHPLITKIALAFLALFLLGAFFTLRLIANQYPNNYEFLFRLIENMVPRDLPLFAGLFNEHILADLFCRTAFFAFAASSVLAALSLVHRQKRLFPVLLVCLIVLQGADIYGFKLSQIRSKTIPLTDTFYGVTSFQKMPYPERRGPFLSNTPRTELLQILPLRRSSFYWSINAFLFKDELGHSFRTDRMLSPLDRYLKAYGGQSIRNTAAPPLGLLPDRLEFPRHHPAALKISGATEDKLQFFSEAKVGLSGDKIAAWITDPDYQGDTLFLSRIDNGQENRVGSRAEVSVQDLSASSRLNLSYQVKRFDSNHLIVTVDNTSLETAWLLYSDIWHPQWRATVNGKQVPVYKANLAYKAVRLQKGRNTVHFFYKSRWVAFIYALFGVNALFWLMIIIGMVGRIAFYDFWKAMRSAVLAIKNGDHCREVSVSGRDLAVNTGRESC